METPSRARTLERAHARSIAHIGLVITVEDMLHTDTQYELCDLRWLSRMLFNSFSSQGVTKYTCNVFADKYGEFFLTEHVHYCAFSRGKEPCTTSHLKNHEASRLKSKLAWSVECLSLKPKDLSSDPQYLHKNLGVVAHGYNPTSEAAETERSMGLASLPYRQANEF